MLTGCSELEEFMIESLTEEQISKFPEYVNKWINIGLSTEPANKVEAEKDINLCYQKAGIEPPKKIVWCGSPLSQGIARAIILKIKNIDLDSVGDSVRDSVGDSVFGSHNAGWLSFYDFMRNELNLTEQTEKLEGLFELSKHCGWIIPHENICFASERHSVLFMDERGRLHSVSSPAIMYPDGWKIYAIHGVRVPEYIVERPSEITIEKIEQEKNAEIRRVMIDIYGVHKYFEECGAMLIHSDKYGKLYKKEIEDDEDMVMVRVINSTGEPDGTFKEYLLRVPPSMETAHQAVAWTFDRTPETYSPIIET